MAPAPPQGKKASRYPFPPRPLSTEVIVVTVRWYLRYNLSYRDSYRDTEELVAGGLIQCG